VASRKDGRFADLNRHVPGEDGGRGVYGWERKTSMAENLDKNTVPAGVGRQRFSSGGEGWDELLQNGTVHKLTPSSGSKVVQCRLRAHATTLVPYIGNSGSRRVNGEGLSSRGVHLGGVLKWWPNKNIRREKAKKRVQKAEKRGGGIKRPSKRRGALKPVAGVWPWSSAKGSLARWGKHKEGTRKGEREGFYTTIDQGNSGAAQSETRNDYGCGRWLLFRDLRRDFQE